MNTRDFAKNLYLLQSTLQKLDELQLLFQSMDSESNLNYVDPNHLSLFAGNFKGLDFSKIFLELNNLKVALNQFSSQNDGFYKFLITFVQDFEDKFQKFIKSFQPIDTSELIASGKRLMTARSTVLEFIQFYIDSLIRSEKSVLDDEKILSLNFYNTHRYEDVLTKLEKIDEIYSELCFLFNISESEYPLRIIKIETGSLLVVIIGNLAIIGFIIWLLKESIKFIHRNFTLEGQINGIPKKIEVAEKALNFTKRLEEQGIETKAIKSGLEKSMLKIINPLNELVSDQAKMRVGDEEISIGQDFEQKYLEENEQKLIGDGNSFEQEENSSKDSEGK